MSGILHGAIIGSYKKPPVETLVDRTLGTNIGDMTVGSGLAASFDGNTNQSKSACSSGSTGPATFKYVGKNHGSGKIPSKVIVYGSNDFGYSNNGDSITIDFKASNSSPSAATDGTLLGTISFTSSDNENTGRTITSSDTSTSYQYWWVKINITSNSDTTLIAEVQMYEML